ncbi:MAG: STAS domain-containing protein [Spirochaetes bacterium]|nr:STAS domain-containing protein [Spirochaetota bacterium]
MLDKTKGLTFRIDEEPNLHLVHLSGDLNMFSAPELRTALHKKFDEGHRKFILDLSELSFVDSSGIGVLVSFVGLARKAEGRVVLFGLNTQIRSIFEVTRLLSVFTVVDDIAAARETLATV